MRPLLTDSPMLRCAAKASLFGRMGEPKKGMEGLLLLLQRVRLEAARRAAAPAERLLDDVLRLLDPTRPVDDEQAYQVQIKPSLPCRAGALPDLLQTRCGAACVVRELACQAHLLIVVRSVECNDRTSVALCARSGRPCAG